MTPENHRSKNTLAIVDLGAKIHLAKKSARTIDLIIMSNNMIAIIPDGSTLHSSNISTLQLPGQRKQGRKIHISQK